MSPKKKPEPEPEEPAEGSRTAGALVLTVLAGAGLGGIYAASPAAAVGTVWVLGAGTLWKAARRPTKIENHSPPPPEPPSREEKPQFTIVEDREGHCTVQWTKSG
jgi:hypothetical protein